MLTEGVDSTKEMGNLSDGRRIYNFTSHLHLRNIQERDVGNFQCIITNKFGSAYTHKANITIHGMMFSFFSTVSFIKYLLSITRMLS